MKNSIVIACGLAALLCTSPMAAQQTTDRNMLNHLDVGLSMGVTGIGVELSMPVGNSVRVRTGYDWMPQFHKNMSFGIQVGNEVENKYDSQGNRVETKFDKLAKSLEEFTGNKIDDQVELIGKPTLNNWKVLVDVYPLRNKQWHVTAGFFLGPANIAKAYNRTEEMQSLLALDMYNNIHDKVENEEPIFNGVVLDRYEGAGKTILEYGRMGMGVGEYKNIFETDEAGNVVLDDQGNPVRKTYIMEPDNDGMVKATMRVNSFKPYLGFGYRGLVNKRDKRTYIAFDCGVLFWGGKPKVITHDGVDLVNDLVNVRGSVGDYVDLVRKFTVCPHISVSISRTLF